MTRIESDPELRCVARQIRRLGKRQKRYLAVISCRAAFKAAGLVDADAQAALAKLQALEAVGDQDRIRLGEIAARVDDEYLTVLDEGEGEDVSYMFARARAWGSLVMALQADSEAAAMEALYEAAIGTGGGRAMAEELVAAAASWAG